MPWVTEDRTMNDERHGLPCQIMPMEAVTVSGLSEDPERAEPWSFEQPVSSALDGTLSSADLPGQGEAATNNDRTSQIDQMGIMIPEAPSAWVPEIRPPNRDDVPISVAPRGGRGLRMGLVTAALVAALGLGWTGGWNLYRFFDPNPTSTQLQQNAIPDRTALGIAQDTTSGGPKTREASPPAARDPDGGPNIGREPSSRAAQPAITPTKIVPSTVHQNTTSTDPAAGPIDPSGKKFQSRLTPTPDTRPNTIEGWTVRHVFAGTAILEGPGGIRKVSVGDTVPGVGRVDSIVRWGNRWIVATSRGLMTTD